MKLNLGMNVNPKDTLRLWSAELRKRLFSSPEEFVLTAFDPTPATIIGAGYSIDQIFLENNTYCQHGKIVFVNINVFVIITSGGGTCSINLKLPVKHKAESVPLVEQFGVGVVSQGFTTAELALGFIQQDSANASSINIYKQGMAAMAGGGWSLSLSMHYAAA